MVARQQWGREEEGSEWRAMFAVYCCSTMVRYSFSTMGEAGSGGMDGRGEPSIQGIHTTSKGKRRKKAYTDTQCYVAAERKRTMPTAHHPPRSLDQRRTTATSKWVAR